MTKYLIVHKKTYDRLYKLYPCSPLRINGTEILYWNPAYNAERTQWTKELRKTIKILLQGKQVKKGQFGDWLTI